MPIVQQGALNTTALVIPDTYVQVVPPKNLPLNGVPSNVLAAVGSASWGPVNSLVFVGGVNQGAQIFGPVKNRKYDLMTIIAAAEQQGANVFAAVRVTDGTDAAATIAVQTNCITFTSKYTGSEGNKCQVSIGPGSQANTYRVTVAMPGLVAEVFDNLAAGLSGNAVWVSIAAAINAGVYGLQGPSALITAAAGAGTTTPTTATYTLTGGLDGATSVTSTILVGSDTTPRTGMYALRGSGAAICVLADCDTPTTWPTQVTFGLSEQMFMVVAGPQSESISSAITAKSTNGIDSYAMKVLLGDWVYWLDTANGATRLVSPAAFAAGKMAAMSPEQSTLNKQLGSVVGTQASYAGRVYSAADLQQLSLAGIDVICNPIPAGRVFGCRFGRNSSSDPRLRGENYTRMTNYLATTIVAGMGRYVGQLQSVSTRREAKSTIESFLAALEQQGMIGTPDGSPAFQVVLDNSNNLPQRVALGYMQADVKVIYLSVIEYLLVNMEGGQTVQITRQTQTFAR